MFCCFVLHIVLHCCTAIRGEIKIIKKLYTPVRVRAAGCNVRARQRRRRRGCDVAWVVCRAPASRSSDTCRRRRSASLAVSASRRRAPLQASQSLLRTTRARRRPTTHRTRSPSQPVQYVGLYQVLEVIREERVAKAMGRPKFTLPFDDHHPRLTHP